MARSHSQIAPPRAGQPAAVRQAWLWGVALLALAAVVYVPTLQNGYVSDDSGYVVENFALRSAEGLYDIWFTIGTVQQYYPLVFTMFWGEYHLWGLDATGYHLVNLLLHALAAILLWRVLVRLEVPGAWLAAAIFTVHPVEVESVAWISERKNVLSCALALGAMLAYWRFAPPDAETDSRHTQPIPGSWKFYLLAMLLFVGALLSKSVTASLPAVLLVIDWWKRGRVTWRDVKPLLPFFAVGIGMGLLTIWMEKVYVGAQGDRFNFTIVDRLLIAGRAVWFYAGKLVWPYPLMFFYPRWTIDAHVWWQYLFPISAVALLVVLWAARHRIGRGPLAAALIFGGVLVPAIGFFDVFPFRFSFVADHYQYHASIALIALAAATLTTVVERLQPQTNWALPAVSVAVLVPLTWLAHQKTYVYWDDFTLHADVARLYPDSWVAHNNLAGIYLKEKKYPEAIDSLRRTIDLIPSDPVPHGNLGRVLTEMGRYDEAMVELDKAMELHVDPDERAWIERLIGDLLLKQNKLDEALAKFNSSLAVHPEYSALMHRGQILAMRGDPAAALNDLDLSLQLQPDSFDARELRAKVYASIGEFDKALSDLHNLEAQLPTSADVQIQLAVVLQAAGRADDALAAFDRALALDPDSATAYLGRGDLHLARGELRRAAADYASALESKPADIAALNNLAWILATAPDAKLRDGDRAVELATAACQATEHRRPDLLSTLAAAQAEAGDFASAKRTLQQAIELAEPALRTSLVEQRSRYEQNQPWRDPPAPPETH